MKITHEYKAPCRDCPSFMLKATTDTMYAGGKIVDRFTTIACANRDLCDRIQTHLLKTTWPEPECQLCNGTVFPNAFSKDSYQEKARTEER